MSEKIQGALVPADHEMIVYQTMAKQAVDSKFYRNYGDASAVMTLMLSARELGISPMAALNGGLNIIQGKVEISARMMNALVRRAGHSITTVKCTDDECVLKGKRIDNGDESEASFTIEEAKKAGLVKPNGGWSKYPSDMLFARTLSRLARRLFPDVVGCAYVEGEIIDSRANKTPCDKDLEEVEVIKEDTTQLNEFLKEFDKEEAMFIHNYISQVHEKWGKSYEEIIDKYRNHQSNFMENFEKWKKQQLSK